MEGNTSATASAAAAQAASLEGGQVSSSEINQAPQDKVSTLASELHDEWRKAWKAQNPDFQGEGFPPRVKTTKDQEWVQKNGGNNQVDIANTSYSDLPSDWQAENKASAEVAMDQVDTAANLGRPVDDLFLESASDVLHQKWLERNGAWAPEEQKKPYQLLSDSEKEKDRVIIRKAIEVQQRPSPQIETATKEDTPTLVAKYKDILLNTIDNGEFLSRATELALQRKAKWDEFGKLTEAEQKAQIGNLAKELLPLDKLLSLIAMRVLTSVDGDVVRAVAFTWLRRGKAGSLENRLSKALIRFIPEQNLRESLMLTVYENDEVPSTYGRLTDNASMAEDLLLRQAQKTGSSPASNLK